MIHSNIPACFTAAGVCPWYLLVIPVSAFVLPRDFQDVVMASAPDRYLLVLAANKVAEAEATLMLEAADDKVLSILSSSIENSSIGNDLESIRERESYV